MPNYDAAAQRVLAWLDEPPWYDPDRRARQQGFSYDDWLARGRKLPRLIESLVAILNAEDPLEPRDASMRAIYTLGLVGNKSRAVSDAVARMLRNRWVLTSANAAIVLQTQGDTSAVPALAAVLRDRAADANTRSNAALAIAALAPREAHALLQPEADDPEPVVRSGVARALKDLPP